MKNRGERETLEGFIMKMEIQHPIPTWERRNHGLMECFSELWLENMVKERKKDIKKTETSMFGGLIIQQLRTVMLLDNGYSEEHDTGTITERKLCMVYKSQHHNNYTCRSLTR